MKLLNRFAIFLLVAAVMASCTKTDLNQRCSLYKKNPDGGSLLPILEGDLRSKSLGNKDFVNNASFDCEGTYCVRDAEYSTDAGSNDPAYGYCSKQCAPGAVCPSYDEALDKGSTALSCKALLLDLETLARLKELGLSPGNISDPYFCARGASALRDSGM
jgi:hypothetical protein